MNKQDNKEYMLTTIDNPFNPFTNFEEWFLYDTEKGYNTCGYLARIANVDYESSEELQELAIDSAMDDIVKEDLTGLYIKVTKDNKIFPVNLEKETQ